MKPLDPRDRPRNIVEAVDLILAAFGPNEVRYAAEDAEWVGKCHMMLGLRIRNEWGLWHTHTPLRNWMREAYGIGHPDDMSHLILEAVHCRLTNRPFEPSVLVEAFRQHWANLGCDLTGTPRRRREEDKQ